MSDDGTVYVVTKADYDCSLICGIFTTLDEAKACIDRIEDKHEFNVVDIHRISLDCDYDALAAQPVFRHTPQQP